MGYREVSDLINQHGFAVAFAAVALVLGVWYIKHLARGLQSSNEVLTSTVVQALQESRKDLREKDRTITNHIEHLTASVNSTNLRISETFGGMNKGLAEIVEAIHGETALMKEMLSRPCPLRDTTKEG